MKKKIGLNRKQNLYWIAEGKGFGSMGFDRVIELRDALAKEMLLPPMTAKRGTIKAYREYESMVQEARRRNSDSGFRSEVCLSPQLVGKEGCRVEVVDCYGEKRRFIVGKSNGWIPCHLEIPRADSSGGGAVTGAPFKTVRIIEKIR